LSYRSKACRKGKREFASVAKSARAVCSNSDKAMNIRSHSTAKSFERSLPPQGGQWREKERQARHNSGEREGQYRARKQQENSDYPTQTKKTTPPASKVQPLTSNI
jgi:hypothetical protein